MTERELQDWVVRGSIMDPAVPRIECQDGFSLSVQAGDGIYSTPRTFMGPYTHMEVGFPSAKVDEFMEWAEDPEEPTETVYGYVPVSVILEVINSHGGMK